MCLRVQQIEWCYKDGSTKPLRCALSNGTKAVVKYRNNQESTITLVNEFIANNLAKQIGIAALTFGTCTLDMNADIAATVDQSKFTLDKDYCGTAYYLEYVPDILPFSPAGCSRYNRECLMNMLLFDHMIYNKDRARRNILVPNDLSNKIIPIDYSHVFKNECLWNRTAFSQGIQADDYIDNDILNGGERLYRNVFLSFAPETNDFSKLRNNVLSQLTDSSIQSIMDCLPSEWYNDIEVGVEDFSALKNYLLYRIDHIDDMISMIIEEGRESDV